MAGQLLAGSPGMELGAGDATVAAGGIPHAGSNMSLASLMSPVSAARSASLTLTNSNAECGARSTVSWTTIGESACARTAAQLSHSSLHCTPAMGSARMQQAWESLSGRGRLCSARTNSCGLQLPGDSQASSAFTCRLTCLTCQPPLPHARMRRVSPIRLTHPRPRAQFTGDEVELDVASLRGDLSFTRASTSFASRQSSQHQLSGQPGSSDSLASEQQASPRPAAAQQLPRLPEGPATAELEAAGDGTEPAPAAASYAGSDGRSSGSFVFNILGGQQQQPQQQLQQQASEPGYSLPLPSLTILTQASGRQPSPAVPAMAGSGSPSAAWPLPMGGRAGVDPSMHRRVAATWLCTDCCDMQRFVDSEGDERSNLLCQQQMLARCACAAAQQLLPLLQKWQHLTVLCLPAQVRRACQVIL